METLKAAWAWMGSNWGIIVLVVIPLVAKVLNSVTAHYSERKGLIKFCLFLLDVLDIIKVTPKPGYKMDNTVGSVTKPTDPPVPTPPVSGIILLFLLPVLVLTGCATTESKLIKATPVVTALRQELKTYLNAECEATVDVCKKAGTLKVEDCKELKACWEKRANVYKVTMSLELAIKTGLGLVGLGEEDEAKVILAKVSGGLMDLFSELQNYKIITLK